MAVPTEGGRFRDLVQELGIDRDQVALILGVSRTTVDSFCTGRRKAKAPIVQKLEALVQNKLKIASEKGTLSNPMGELPGPVVQLAGLEVARKSSDKPEWDIMSDGWARGFPGDTKLMRAQYRTPGAWRRIGEEMGLLTKAERFTAETEAKVKASGIPLPPEPDPKVIAEAMARMNDAPLGTPIKDKR